MIISILSILLQQNYEIPSFKSTENFFQWLKYFYRSQNEGVMIRLFIFFSATFPTAVNYLFITYTNTNCGVIKSKYLCQSHLCWNHRQNQLCRYCFWCRVCGYNSLITNCFEEYVKALSLLWYKEIVSSNWWNKKKKLWRGVLLLATMWLSYHL